MIQRKLLNIIVTKYYDILKENLVGVYLHGSLAMDCFNPNLSDIDFLVVVNKEISVIEKRQLISILLKLSETISNGFEMSVILEEDVRNFKYPTPFLLHYSNQYRDKYLEDPKFICGNSLDPDLAAHITIINHRGKCLYGKPIHQLYAQVPKEYYLQSILGDIEDAIDNIVNNPVYFTLNLCRVIYYIREGVVSSKKEGGEWGIKNIPNKYQDIIRNALDLYLGYIKIVKWDKTQLQNFANYILNEIS